ncbi:MAG: hypothetical protein EOM91_13815 [Sphingobacteriia bacterium]|nr:hypothetical protein [Sphingobacteriia bacterium]NCC39558.1 hypothetical protein [Gammaproteobacteria bacterium]
MKLCPKCSRSPYPFFMVFMIASVLAFTTWLMLGLSRFDVIPRAALTAVVFIAVGVTLLHYVIGCLRRHCRHDHTHHAVSK